MAIDSVDDIIAGAKAARFFSAISGNLGTVGAGRAWSSFYSPGLIGAGTAPSIGINGQALSAPLNGTIPRTNPAGGLEAAIGRLAVYCSQPGTLWLIDRLWQNSGLSVTSTSAQSITPVALPARDRNGSTNGDGVLFGVEVTTTLGTGTPTMTLTYTNSAGVAGSTVTHTVVAINAPTSTFEVFPLASGDKGIREPTSYQASATRTTGAISLVGFRPIISIELPSGSISNVIDPISGGLPRIYDDSCLQFLFFPSGTGAFNIFGALTEIHA